MSTVLMLSGQWTASGRRASVAYQKAVSIDEKMSARPVGALS